MRSRSLGFFLAGSVLASLTLAPAAGAVSFTLKIWENGVYQGAVDATALGCGSGASTSCSGTDASLGDLSLDMWSLNVDSDPVVTGTTVVTNTGTSPQRFTMIFTLALGVPVTPTSLIGGSIQGGATDNNGDGVTLSTDSSFYTARIDGVAVQTLYPSPSAISTNAPFDSVNLAKLSFGAPIPSLPGPAANANIAIRLDFRLTPGDSASFTSNFVVLPVSVPEPATFGVLAPLALTALAIGRRWRR